MKKIFFSIIFIFAIIVAKSQLPYTESFETGFGIWTQLSYPEDDFDWTRNSGPTPSPGTGPSAASDGNYYIYIEATGHNNPPKKATIEATFDFSTAEVPIISFDYHQYGLGIGNIFLYVYDGNNWIKKWTSFNNQGDQWHNVLVPLDDYKGMSNVKIRFIAQTQYSDSSDIAIDNIKIVDFKISDTSHTNVSCGGYSDGSLTLQVSGGFPPYYYSIDDGVTYVEDANTSHTFTNLSGGDYPVRVKDQSGATDTMGVVTINEPELLDITTNKVDVSPCIYSHNGKITIHASGNYPPFEYSISGFGGPFQSDSVFSSLDTGTYSIAVKNNNGCITNGGNVQIKSNPPAIMIIDTSSTDVSTCYGDCNGAIDLVVGGGNTPLSYALDTSSSPNYQDNSHFSNLCVGTYRVIIKDNAGCLDTTGYITINQPPELVINTITHTDVTGCYGDSNAEINITASGGTGTIEYSIDNGYNYQDSGHFTNLAAGTYNIVIRDQNNCQTAGGSVTINQPTLLVLDSVVSQNITGCYGNANGQIKIYAHGGTSPISYSIDNGNNYSSTNTFTNLDVGTYYPYIQDANGCKDSAASVTLSQPTDLQITNVNIYDVTDCYGYNSGKIQIYATNGTTPYEYSIDSGATFQSNFTFDSLYAGDYNIVVRDANLCTKSLDSIVTIHQPDSIHIVSTYTSDVTCYGNTDGSLSLTAEGGTGQLHYSIDNGVSFPYANSDTIYIGSGTYQTAVRDDNNCKKSGPSLTITQPDSLLIDSVVSVNVLGCYGDSTGSITIYAKGGTAPYQYSIQNGQDFQDTNYFGNLPARTGYWPYVKDAHNCSVIGNKITIGQPSQLIITNQSHTDIQACYGSPDGTITIEANGGSGKIHYSIDNGTSYQDTGFFDNLYAGTYHTKVKDSHNCVADGWDETIYQPDSMVIDTIITQDIKCFGYGDGKIYITAHGGQPQLRYSIDGGLTYHISDQFTGLTPGHYHIIVKDAYDCEVEDSVEIHEPPQLILDTVIHTNVNTCFGDANATINVFAHGGTQPLLYAYCPVTETPTSYQDTNVFENVGAGSYYVTVLDNNSCMETSSSFTITQPTPVDFDSIKKNDISCNGMDDGNITIYVSGGNGSYYYSIDNGTTWQDTNYFNNLSGGFYYILAKDTNNCQVPYSHSVSINEPTLLQIYSITGSSPTCNGYSDGEIHISATGGTSPYTFYLNDTIVQSSPNYSGLDSGFYWATVIDSHNCVAQSNDTIKLTMPDNLAMFSPDTTTGCSPLEVTFHPDSIYGTYHWFFADGSESYSNTPTHDFYNNSNNIQNSEILVVCQHGLCSDTARGTATVYPQPNLNFTIDTSIHFYPDTTVEITNLTTQYNNYHWNFGDSTTFDGIQPVQHDYTGCGSFNISLIAENNYTCIDTMTRTVRITALSPDATFLTDTIAGCKPLTSHFYNLSTNATRYNWVVDGQIVSTDTNASYTFEDAGNYLVYLYAYGNCGLYDSIFRVINVYPSPEINFTVTPDTQALGANVIFYNNTTNASYYLWDLGDSTYSSDEEPIHSYNSPGYYTIVLKAYSPNNCFASDTMENAVYILDSLVFRMPTAFTPNGDGINDVVVPVGYMIKKCSISYYDRRGHLVFHTDKYNQEFWDGTYKGKPLPTDVYIWRATGEFRTGLKFEKGGAITLLR